MSNSEVGQVLFKGKMVVTISNPEHYVMRPVYCNNCREYLGAYNTYYYPDGLKFKCICEPEVAK